jgi:hypothetical protein
VLGVPRDERHVGDRGADVLGRDVAAAQQLHRLGEVAHQLLAQLARRHGAIGQPDHALAAAEVQPGSGRLQRHRAGQAQRVGDRVVERLVVPHAAAAERRTQRGRMHGDDRRDSRPGTPAHDERLVVHHHGPSIRSRTVPRNIAACAPSSAR